MAKNSKENPKQCEKEWDMWDRYLIAVMEFSSLDRCILDLLSSTDPDI